MTAPQPEHTTPESRSHSWRSWDARLSEPGPFHTRFDHRDGSKEVTWGRFTTRDGLGGHRLEDLVYGGDLVARAHPDATIVLTEGERAADAVREAGYIAAGTVCGASSTPGDAVLGLFRDRHVCLWPDADSVGAEHMSRIATRLERIGVRSLSFVNWPEAQDHDDAVEAAARDLIDPLATGARRLPILQPILCARCREAVA